MFIKQIIIQGFKSYKEQTVMEPFSEKHNVVVGRNGSGKSNFFWAIRFVLGDAYQNMTREERQSLLHEGMGQATISAYVEVIFDNSDNRFPTGREEVVLRRTIGLKKDEYSLDRKSVTKSEVLNLLESAGFSRSNPYYIVPQGRITALTNSKDQERLVLLKEVAGTKVYEQRRHESVKIMNETNTKREQIEELLEYIEKRLDELEMEKKELSEYQTADKDRRCLEYALYNKEQNDALSQLEELEQERVEEQIEAVERYKHLTDRMVVIQELEQQLCEEKQNLDLLMIEKTQMEEEAQDLIRFKAQLSVTVKDTSDSVGENSRLKSALENEKEELTNQIKSSESQLANLIPTFEKILAKESSEIGKLSEMETQLDALSSKQGRFDQFKTTAQRDKWLDQSIKELNSAISSVQEQHDLLQRSFQRNEGEKTSLETEIDNLKTESEKIRPDLLKSEHILHEKKQEKESLENEKKNLWRDEAKLNAKLDSINQVTDKLSRSLMGTVDRNTSKAMRSVPKIVERLGITGFHGFLYELFKVDEALITAVEVVAGNSLFHIVVDTDATAAAILKELNHEKGGRVTFMPLNRLRPKEGNFPDSDRAIPLISRLEYDQRYHLAMLQVFGKAIISPSLEEASSFARSHNLTGVTFEGDRADRKGALSGGFHDFRQSRLETVMQLRDAQNQVLEGERELHKIREIVRNLEQRLLRIRDELTASELEHRHLVERRQTILRDIQSKTSKARDIENLLHQQGKALQSLTLSVENMMVDKQTAEQELGTPLRKKLNANEQRMLESLPSSIEACKRTLSEIVVQRTKIEATKNQLEISLTSDLRRRLDELNQSLANIQDQGITDSSLESQLHQLSEIEKSMATTANKLEVLDTELEELRENIDSNNQRLEKAKSEQAEESLVVERQQRVMEKFLTKKSLLVQKKETAIRHIRELGVLPEEAFEKYLNASTQKLLKSLHQVNETLKKYEHVNKKAFEQYSNFTKQREQLEARKEELDQSAKSIESLISTLDQRKNEAIEQTFSQVAKYFAEVWKRLVPEGDAELVMLQRELDDETQSQNQNGIEQYTGIALNVCFIPGQKLRMSQLSGGQKSLVALTLIFAIQKCDPAPFYLFDEIDAALDTQYRTAVAEMIHELSENAQFITTTFRPELLVHASKFYGVTFAQKVSKIQSIARDHAQQFVENQAAVQ